MNTANESGAGHPISKVDSPGEARSAPDIAFMSTLRSTMGATDSSIDNAIHHLSPGAALVVFFVLGLAMAFTPCTLPMLPIVTSLVVGTRATRGRGLVLCSIFVAAMALVYAGLGLVAALGGHSVQILLQQWWINVISAAVLAALALSMFGFYTLQLPQRVRDRLIVLGGSAKSGTAVGAAVSGIFSALLVGPCMTAPLADARTNGRVAMVDFTADWCTSCKTMDRTVFTDPKAIDALRSVTMIRADVTRPDADARALLKAFDVVGPPTLAFFNADGKERRQSRLVGEADVAQLLSALYPGA